MNKVKGQLKVFNDFIEKHLNFQLEEWKEISTLGKSFLITNA